MSKTNPLTSDSIESRSLIKRSAIFAAWSGEELGLLGSSHYVRANAKMFFADEDAKLDKLFAAALNMDMIGRFENKLVLQGVGSSSRWPAEIEKRNAPIGLPITTQTDSYLATDATSFFRLTDVHGHVVKGVLA